MAATFKEIRDGIAANLAAFNLNCEPYMTDSPLPPMLQIMGVGAVDYDLSMQRGLDEWTLTIQGYQNSPFAEAAQVSLDEWIVPTGATSVKAAVESDITLGGKVEGLRVTGCSGYRNYTLPNLGQVLGAEWTVVIFNTGK